MGRDPIEEKGGLHLYGFVGNNPVNRYDVRGEHDYAEQCNDQVYYYLSLGRPLTDEEQADLTWWQGEGGRCNAYETAVNGMNTGSGDDQDAAVRAAMFQATVDRWAAEDAHAAAIQEQAQAAYAYFNAGFQASFASYSAATTAMIDGTWAAAYGGGTTGGGLDAQVTSTGGNYGNLAGVPTGRVIIGAFQSAGDNSSSGYDADLAARYSQIQQGLDQSLAALSRTYSSQITYAGLNSARIIGEVADSVIPKLVDLLLNPESVLVPRPTVNTVLNAATRKGVSSAGKLQRDIYAGRAPKDVDMAHPANPPMAPEAHVHYTDGTSSTVTGKVHDAHMGYPDPANKTREWLKSHGWIPPS